MVTQNYNQEIEEYETVRKARRFFAGATQLSKVFEESLVDFVSAYAPWAAPLIPMWIGFNNAMNIPGFGIPGAIIYSVVVESLGIATIRTALEFRAWNQEHNKEEQAPFWPAVGTASAYLVVVLLVNVAIDQGDIWQKGIKMFMSLLSVVAGLNIGMRSEQVKRVSATQKAKDDAKVVQDGSQDRLDRLQREKEEREDKARIASEDRARQYAIEDDARKFEQAEIERANARAYDLKVKKLKASASKAPAKSLKVPDTSKVVPETATKKPETFGKYRRWPEVPVNYRLEIVALVREYQALYPTTWRKETMLKICESYGVQEHAGYDWIGYALKAYPADGEQ